MKVYLVFDDMEYDGWWLEKVFSNKKKALDYIIKKEGVVEVAEKKEKFLDKGITKYEALCKDDYIANFVIQEAEVK